jgi:hypothetical protein
MVAAPVSQYSEPLTPDSERKNDDTALHLYIDLALRWSIPFGQEFRF